MLYYSLVRVDPDLGNEWLACLWQGPAPANLAIRESLAMSDGSSILIWEGDDEAASFIERAFRGFGQIETQAVTSSAGMANAIARDLDGYERMLTTRGVNPAEIARQVDLRRRGMLAPDKTAAREAARAWKAEG